MNLLTKIGSLLPTLRRAVVSLRYEPVNVSSSATVATVQSAIRAAEGGDTRELFALYRDLTIGGSHIQCEFGKRLMALLSQPHAILPKDDKSADDIAAAAAIEQMILDCENWTDGIAHLLSSTLWPVAVVEKIFRPADQPIVSVPSPSPLNGERAGVRGEDDDDSENGKSNGSRGATSPTQLRYTLRRLEIVNPTLLCFRQDYVSGPLSTIPSNLTPSEQWESDLRFYSTDAEGRIIYSTAEAYHAEPARHIVHRGHLLVGIRDNWGGPMRSVIFWWLLSVLGRDWFARSMERYGSPFPVGKTDASNQEAVTFLQEAFSLSTKVGGLVVDQDTQVELIEAMTSGMADAHEKFISVCNREISKVVVGQTSAEVQPTGLGSGVSKQQEQVREDIRTLDQIRLGDTLSRQLFEPFLRINGLVGRVKIVWGGLSAEEAASVAKLLVDLKNADLEPTDEAIPTLSERVGFQIQRKEPPPAPTGFGFPPSPGGEGRGEGGPQRPERLSAGLQTFSASGLANGLGVPVTWLSPIARKLQEFERKVNNKTISDRDLIDLLDAGIKELPELFDTMDIDGLAETFEAGMGGAVIDGVRDGLRKRKREGVKT